MKYLIAGGFALLVASSSATAGTLSIDMGSVWWKVAYNSHNAYHVQGTGQGTAVLWVLENDLGLGAYSEGGKFVYNGGTSYNFDVRAIEVTKGIVKNVSVGMNLGDYYSNWGGEDGMFTDLFGTVVILGGSGDKVTGQLKTNVGTRFVVDDATYNMSGYLLSLSLGLLF